VCHFVDVAVGNVLASAYAKAALRGDVLRVLEAGNVSDYCLWKDSHTEAVLHPPGLINLGQLGPEAAAFVSLVKAQCRRMGVPFYSQWWYARISVCLVHYTSLMADHWCQAASDALVRTRDPRMPRPASSRTTATRCSLSAPTLVQCDLFSDG